MLIDQNCPPELVQLLNHPMRICGVMAIFVIGLVYGLLTYILLSSLVLNRLSNLAHQVNFIGLCGDPSMRVRLEGTDELAALATDLNVMLESMCRSESKLRITQFSVDHAADPILWVGPQGEVIYANEAACASLGYPRGELLQMKVFDFDLDIQPENWTKHRQRLLKLQRLTFESRYRARDGRIFPVEITANLLDYNGAQCSCAFIRDITRRKDTDERLRHAAMHDKLTGLPNRALLTEHLSAAIEQSRRHPDYRFAVMFLDFDRFKIINDSLGHQAGDELLVAISGRLQACLRHTDGDSPGPGSKVARLGGDEFVLLLDNIRGTGDATAIAERLQKELSEPFNLNGHQAHVTVSIGIVTSEMGYDSPADIIRDADTAMYQAKSNGKARYVVFDRQMHDQVLARLELESDLRQAIEQDEIHVAYQPIVSLETGDLEGFEALARWTHPRRGEISPEKFIPIAEETGLILPLGRMILREACYQWHWFRREIPNCPPLVMSVNVSKRQLLEADLPAQIERMLAETGVPPSALKLEVTESVIMEDAETITPMLARLRRIGIKLAMDDFGQGHSSLGCLHKFPIDYLKIDRVFVRNMGITDAGLNIEYTAIVQAIVTLAHNLGMQVVAEGVENLGQVVQLQSLGCDFGQGYYFSTPATPEQATNLITRKSWVAVPAETCAGQSLLPTGTSLG
ncbi:MAG TPA: EAL domain-containing protein [Phycisphaerae bacterium]|nr:EAL domain-containing protein [Phycisphaerae bacterium]HOB76154.1 EAL domain-containing protein [Phycisphaerae bacterium]HOJ56178.1 EAL domain-containing protein [Phycisphaerae bacterium]HOL28258.1 EAL domain-containing protein [Phycisphaerae bacterium]HPP22640.1 EAL domain-containing protein [Phycisphaerae bacterium]